MNKQQLNRKIQSAYKRFKNPKYKGDEYFKMKEKLQKELSDLIYKSDSLNGVTKNNLIRLASLQSSIRFLQMHSFLLKFSFLADELEL